MAGAREHADRILFSTILFLVVGGIFIFLSASLGLLAGDGAEFGDVAKNQLILGLGGGGIAFLIGLSLSYKIWRKFALYIFIAAVIMTFLVFVPHLGISLNGARRWIAIGPFTFQPIEFLKIAYILYLAAFFSGVKSKVQDIRFGLVPYLIITGIVGVALLLQPDTDGFMIIAASGLAMFIAAGAKWRDLLILVLVGILGAGLIIATRPYIASRVMTFLHPSSDPHGSSYQIQQSLLAVGAGEIFGRGFGQSIQKFGKLPEPISDSIFSVFSEEFGFIGSAALVIAYLIFALRGLWVSARAPDLFGGLVALGIVILITSESYLNIAAMLGVFPLSGLPLVFISHGGSALFMSLASAGILLSVSRSVRR